MARLTVDIEFRVDAQLKRDYENACTELGLTTNEAFIMFATKVAAEKRIPFEIAINPFFNEFFNHQLAHNQIFLEVENDGCDFVFSALVEKFPGRVLHRPKAQEILHYGTDDGIIIDRLVTEAPKSNGEPYQVPLEKLIVDLFANKNLILSKGDYPSAIETMFATYRIDQVSMLRYARRRNKVKDVFEFLRDKTSIALMVHL
ncbi:MAG: type II toxin-antitoxin system RelB/DinJ family antitoxin [Sphaerochaetaceae bacterium]|nr:type II toxin-antitoxin system RelB/DinJ family antitoxin [Sphaerochaetaceae bacterium]